ncbi:MAG: malto-oligosyltrehalose trehalohydrolase [Bacteroidales bacterium]
MTYKGIFPSFTNDNNCEFNLWSPKAKDIKLVFKDSKLEIPLNKQEFGYWNVTLDITDTGRRYKYKIDDDGCFPDPGSLSQPEGVHGYSEVINIEEFEWTDQEWKNIAFDDMIQYEIHAGTFSDEGTFEGIISKLSYLKELGINTIEILPVSQFSGERNWGYDGVYPFAVQDSYGGPKALMKLVNECHNQGIAVILDVVYNHFGPEGNYTSQFGPYFSGKYSTPWGKPLNFDGPYSDGVRNFVIQNALMWCRDFHIDGLRLDAVHAIYDFSAIHIMRELAENLQQLSKHMQKEHYLIAESNLNDVRYINPIEGGGYGLDAQWSDDFHHAIHTLATKENKGYYMDFGKSKHLSKSIKEAFVYDGKYSEFRKKTYGNSTEDNAARQFVIFNQNHDQIGNRKYGERLISLTGYETAKLVAGTMFVTPNIPMLFMGEEYGERSPFFYFVSHLDPHLNKLVRKGRSEEFKDFHDDNKEAPDPASPDTFMQSKLSWRITEDDHKKSMLSYYKALISLRKSHPVLKIADKDKLEIFEEGELFTLRRWKDGDTVLCFMNFTEEDQSTRIPEKFERTLNKILDSTHTRFMGPGETSPELVHPGEPIKVVKNSIIIYSN